MASLDDVYCLNCGAREFVKLKRRGSMFWMWVMLIFCFIVPGLLYWLWMLTHWKRVCAVCGSANVVPIDSPRALEATRSRPGG